MLPIQGRLIILTAAIVGLLFGLHDLHISNTDPALGKVTGLSTVVKDSWTDQLTKRSKDTKYGPTQLSFNDAVRKGEIWIASLPGPPATNQRTQFTDFGQLATYGWSEEEKHEETDGSAELIELGDPLTANGITDKSRFQAIGMLQDGGYPVQGDVNPADATMGQYAQLYDPDHGIIVPIQNYSPQEVAKGTDQYPALQRWSDVVFLTWASVCQKTGGSEKVKGLKHFFRYHIKPKSTPTLNIILEALGVKGPADVKIWPPNQDHIDGQTFDANSDEGKALIGTPHGSGICWFLWQHQDDLGTKTIDKITVFRTTAPGEDEKMNDWVNLHFLIKEAEKK